MATDAAVNAVALLPDGAGFVTAGDDAAVLVWRFGERAVRRLFGPCRPWWRSTWRRTAGRVARRLGPDGQGLGHRDGRRAPQARRHGERRRGPVRRADGAAIVTAGADGTIRLRRARDGSTLAVLGGGRWG
ncbi:MAG: hypothetical protein R3D28_09675 [Geminicoccaceae bacterium]